MDRACAIFLAGPDTSQEYITQILTQFDTHLSASIPCCILTSSGKFLISSLCRNALSGVTCYQFYITLSNTYILGEAPVWCGAECPGTAADTPVNWSTSLAGVRVDEAKLKAGNTNYTPPTV